DALDESSPSIADDVTPLDPNSHAVSEDENFWEPEHTLPAASTSGPAMPVIVAAATDAAMTDAAASTREHSTYDDFRDRLLRRDPPVETIAADASLPDTAASPPEGNLTGSPPDEVSPILVVGHDQPSSGWRHSLRRRGQPLEAPTPYSAIAQEVPAAASATGDPRREPAPGSTPPSGPPQEGFVGSLFDVFGIGGDRASESSRGAVSPLRQASITQLDRSAVGGDEKQSAPSTDALRKSLQTVHWQEELDRLTALLETQLAHQTPGESSLEQDYYMRQHVALRLLYLIGSRRPEALQAIPDCDPSQQEFWIELLWALSDIFDDEALPDQSRRARETAARLRAALTHITPQAGLHLKRTLFCRQINGFGSYMTFERDEFSPGQTVLVYTEVENFSSEPTPQGEFVTTLQSTLRIQRESPTGPILFEEQLPASEDTCQSRRLDYFHSYRITLPTNLTPGPHVLTLTVRDQASQNLGTATLNFVVR
ncbi:MAG: hypothetical protein AB7U20_17405, partial [Planctomycetaceae bacterium]